MNFSTRVVMTALLMVGSIFCMGQDPGNPMNPSDGQYFEDHGIDSVNLQNLSIGLDISVRSKRGAIPFTYTLTGTSSCVAIKGGIGNNPNAECGIGINKYYTQSSGANWNLTGATPENHWHANWTSSSTGYCAADGGSTTIYSGYYLTGPDFTTYYLPSTDKIVRELGGTACITTIDDITVNGGVHAQISGITALVVYPPNGFTYPGATVTDAFGNSISFASNIYTDTLNTHVLTIAPHTATVGEVDSWTDTTGAAQQITSVLSPATIKTTFGCTALQAEDTNQSGNVLSEIDYPDGNNVYFTYEPVTGGVTGRIKSITLRTGGVITYSYGAINCASLIPSSLSRTTADGTTSYTFATFTGQGTSWGTTTTVLDPGKNKAVYTFMGTQPSGLPNGVTFSPITLTEVQKWQNTGTIAAPVYTLLTTDIYCYNGNTANCPTTKASYQITSKDSYHTVGSMTTSSRVSTTYDPTYGNVLSVAKYDFGVSSFTTKTTTTYGSWDGSTCVGVGSGILNLPCDVVTTDGTHTLSEARLTYNSKGALTASTKWTGSTWLTRTFVPNANGTVASSVSQTGVASSHVYGCNNLLPTQTTVGGLISHVGWDCNNALGMSTTDPNGNGTSTSYDLLNRPLSYTDLANLTVNMSYASNSVTASSTYGTSITTVDGYGRTVRTQRSHGSSYDTVTTAYNLAANTVKTSVPCTAPLGADCTTGFTTATIDITGKPMLVVDGVNATSILTYAGSTNEARVTSVLSPAPSGENVKTFVHSADGLGRATSDCGVLSSGGSACGHGSSSNGILTAYTYATAAGSTTTTATRGSESRTVVADALGRPLSKALPESGTTTYTYDSYAPGTCGGWKSEPGKLMLVSRANGTSECFVYADGLKRPTDFGGGSDCRRLRYDVSPTGVQTPPAGYVGNNLKGRLVEAETDTCGLPISSSTMITDEWFSYDVMGNLTDVWEATPNSGGYYHTTATYFANGAVNTLSGIPGYATITYGIDADGQPSMAMLGTTTLVAGVTYGPLGPTAVSIGTGTDEDDYSYYSTTGRMKTYQFFVNTANTKGTLTWNTNGTLGTLAVVDGFNAGGTHTCNFAYDDIARLVTDNCGTPWSQSFTYDIYNNLTKAGSSAWNPGYNTKNQYSGIGATYDASGNLTWDGTNHYTWDGYGKMTSAGVVPTCGTAGTCITYDALGRAVEKSINSTYTEILYSPLGKTAEMAGATSVNYAYIPTPGGGTVRCANAGCGSKTYWHKDWLGTTRLGSTVINQTVTFDRAFAPYGELYLTTIGGTSTPGFTGDTQDLFGGLYDTPNRELSSQGRWLSPDPAGSGWNAYAYPTNPNSDTDLSGLRRCASGVCTSNNMVDADLGGGGEFPGGSWQALDPDNLTNGCGGDPNCSSSKSTRIDISNTYSDTWPPQLTPRSNAPVTNPLDDDGPQFSRDYSMIPFVPGSGFNGVGNWLHDNIVESFQWLHDEMEKCVMCGPSLSTVVGMVLDASMPTLYRGGNRFVPKPGEFRLNPDGTVKTGYGLSVNTDSDAMVEQFGSATQIKGLPTGLTAIQRGKNLAHWEIVPAEEGYTMEEVLELLDKIDRVPIE